MRITWTPEHLDILWAEMAACMDRRVRGATAYWWTIVAERVATRLGQPVTAKSVAQAARKQVRESRRLWPWDFAAGVVDIDADFVGEVLHDVGPEPEPEPVQLDAELAELSIRAGLTAVANTTQIRQLKSRVQSLEVALAELTTKLVELNAALTALRSVDLAIAAPVPQAAALAPAPIVDTTPVVTWTTPLPPTERGVADVRTNVTAHIGETVLDRRDLARLVGP